MQRHRILFVTAAIACAPLGCQTMSDVFNEPPADTERAERMEDERDDDDDTRERDADTREAREEAKRDVRVERRDDRERTRDARRESRERESRREARREAREDAREDARAERRAERDERRADRPRDRARDYIAASSCPVQVEGARVSMVDVVDGIALEFKADNEEDAATVQERSRRLMNTQREVESARDIGDPELEALPPARVEYDIQDDGARIEFKVDSESDLRELRTQLRERMDILNEEGECPRDFMTMLEGRSGRAG